MTRRELNRRLREAERQLRDLDRQFDATLCRDGADDGAAVIWDGDQYVGGARRLTTGEGEDDETRKNQFRWEFGMNRKLDALNTRLGKSGLTVIDGRLLTVSGIDLSLPPDIRQQVLAYERGVKGFTLARVARRLAGYGEDEYLRRFANVFPEDEG
jgi:hypothetical protein